MGKIEILLINQFQLSVLEINVQINNMVTKSFTYTTITTTISVVCEH